MGRPFRRLPSRGALWSVCRRRLQAAESQESRECLPSQTIFPRPSASRRPQTFYGFVRRKTTMSNAEKIKASQFTNPETPGYVGFANLPNQVHRKSVKKGFEFTLMVVGESGLGKSTLINSLFLTDLYPERIIPGAAEKIERTVQIEASTVEIEERGVKLRLTVVDTPGYGDAINSQDCFSTIISYIDDQFERYLHDESGLNRRHIVDNRVHCCFYFISPLGHGLKPLDVQFMKAIHNKVNVVPVIAKADTLTLRERERLKRRILDEIDEHGIKIYHLPDAESDEDEDFKEQTRILKASIPFAVVGSNQQIEAKGKKVRGRLYPWGVVEVENPEHNDFLKLRTMLITHMQDLQEVTQDLHYENFRSERLKRSGRKGPEPEEMDKDMILQEKEAELRRMQEMIAKMQAQMQKQGDGDDV
ncbi:septin-2 isoform X2 [Nerophis ophidion]|uniref:septin-2 isoform X2 n=2 Tax=Nerophis TaxID=159076 RepID=UPI002ADF112E|nr:septin-2 isoform X2 [Nerophis ophidion]